MSKADKIIITGGAGLVGQNLVARLKDRGYRHITVIDKAATNAGILREHHPDIEVIVADLAADDGWQDALAGAAALVHAHAQIGGLDPAEFVRNNATASERVMAAAVAHAVPYIVNISSSVVNSAAVDDYTETKKVQEAIVAATGIPQVILRPTLMFGWFDRKHVGWLARFMERVPVFPVPGTGRFLRQPLYVADFCNVIVAAIEQRITGAYNITGQERIDYIDLVRAMKRATGARAVIVCIPYGLFALLLRTYALVDSNPPFTEKQLAALVTPDVFEVIDWPGIFRVKATPLQAALDETFRHPVYSKIALQFSTMSKQFASFIVTGGIAAGVNLVSRWGFNWFMRFEFAVALGYLAGMTTAFVLARRFVFDGSGGSWLGEYWRFAMVNVMSFLVVLGVSVGLADYAFPALGMTWHAHDVAHLIGVLSPIVLSFYAHKHFSFARRN